MRPIQPLTVRLGIIDIFVGIFTMLANTPWPTLLKGRVDGVCISSQYLIFQGRFSLFYLKGFSCLPVDLSKPFLELSDIKVDLNSKMICYLMGNI